MISSSMFSYFLYSFFFFQIEFEYAFLEQTFLWRFKLYTSPLISIDLFVMQATSAYNGVGVVKLMGRQSGFIAMHASLASGQVDVCLIPEVTFPS